MNGEGTFAAALRAARHVAGVTLEELAVYRSPPCWQRWAVPRHASGTPWTAVTAEAGRRMWAVLRQG